VTSLEFQMHPVGPTVALVATIHAIDDAGAVLRAWRDIVETLPDEVTSAAFLPRLLPGHPNMPPELHNKQILMIVGVHCGEPDEGERVMAPLRRLGAPLADISGPYPYRAVQSLEDEALGVKGSLHAYWKSTYLPGLTDEVIDMLVDRILQIPAAGGLVNIPHIGRGVRRVGPAETAVGRRDAPYMVSADAIWLDPADTEASIAWTRKTWDMLQPHATGQVFINFTGEERGEAADDVVRGAYSDNYDRLVAVKTKYDPTNLFRLNQNIRPKAVTA
jgi:FAD/FMN-containing dehydrogenase